MQLAKVWFCAALRLAEDGLRNANLDLSTSTQCTPSRAEAPVERHRVLDGHMRQHVAGRAIDSGQSLYRIQFYLDMADGNSRLG